MKISKYNPGHDDDIVAAIRKDPDWDMFSPKFPLKIGLKSV